MGMTIPMFPKVLDTPYHVQASTDLMEPSKIALDICDGEPKGDSNTIVLFGTRETLQRLAHDILNVLDELLPEQQQAEADSLTPDQLAETLERR